LRTADKLLYLFPFCGHLSRLSRLILVGWFVRTFDLDVRGPEQSIDRPRFSCANAAPADCLCLACFLVAGMISHVSLLHLSRLGIVRPQCLFDAMFFVAREMFVFAFRVLAFAIYVLPWVCGDSRWRCFAIPVFKV
jgi:hypothetical protein